MTRTKQTGRKQNEANLSASGLPLAVGSSSENLSPSMSWRSSPRNRPSATSFTSDEGTSEEGSRWRKWPRIEDDDDDDSQSEPTPKSHKTTGGGRPSRKLAATKMTWKTIKQTPQKQMSMRELTADWNWHVRIGLKSETLQGWLKTTKKTRDGQQRALRHATPGVKALKEIWHYMRCQQFLIAVLPFQWLVQEITCNISSIGDSIRWQSNALFSLQSSAEAYMSGYFHDVHLCALHWKVKTISRQDIWLAIQIRGRDHVGGKTQLSDVGVTNAAGYTMADTTEKKAVLRRGWKAYAVGHDWCAELRQSVAIDMDPPKKAPKPKPGMKRVRCVLKNSIHGIAKATFCRMVRRGSVERMSRNVFEESRGVLKVFLEHVIKDAIIYTTYCHRKTVTAMDVIYALKRHGRTLYGFTRPYSFSRKVDKDIKGTCQRT